MAGFSQRWRVWWDEVHQEHSDHVENVPDRWIRPAIFLASALTLYVEMVMVRWHASCFHAFAIFKNVSLLSCFLGLGIGYGLSGRRTVKLGAFLPLLSLQVLLFGVLSLTNLGGRRVNPVAEQLVMGSKSEDWSWLHAVEGNAFLAVVFVLNALMFIPLGHLAGRLMTRLPKVQSYSLNVLGSLCGIGLFFLLSLAWTGPSVWLGFVALGLAPFIVGHRRSVGISVASLGCIVIALGLMSSRQETVIYSPYQVISLRLPDHVDKSTLTIKVNHCFFQDIFDCRPTAVAQDKDSAHAATYYNFPYQLRGNPGDVLVVGAGSGNDVAGALRNGATTVTAVEIDPAVQFLGKKLHPERVYQDPRTIPVVNDARSFLRQTDQRFDTIIYGLLDSHTNLGAMTNVRLDSFVYTLQGFQEAVARLKDNGLLVVSYLVLDPNQGKRLYAMMRDAYPEQKPRAFHGAFGTIFVTGPGLREVPAAIAGAEEQTAEFIVAASQVELATDDWPFFYMQERAYPFSYLIVIGLLLGLSTLMVKRHLGMPNLLNAPTGMFFFLGAGFMLVETKTITELGLTFGNTWAVVGVVISGILLLAYLANQWVAWRGPVNSKAAFVLLGLTLVLGLGLTRLQMAGAVLPAPKLVLPLALLAPLFFAGLIFSSELVRGGELGGVLAANLFGAMLGGFLEYNSMYLGFSSLYPLGMVLYGIAFLCLFRVRRHSSETEPTVSRSRHLPPDLDHNRITALEPEGIGSCPK